MKKALLIGAAMLSTAVQAEPLDIERIFASPSLDGNAPRALKVSPDGERVTFLKGKQTDYERLDLWEYHIDSGETRLLFDSNDLQSGEEVLSDEEKARRERMRLSGSGIVSYQWSADGKALLFPLGGDVYYHKLGEKGAKQLLDTDVFETDIKLSPKGNYISFIRDQNLFVKHIESGKETAITKEGGGNIKFGMAEFVAQEEMGRMTGYWWSPDESFIAFTKVDESPVDVISRSEIYADDIKTIEQKYPKAGTNNVLVELAIQNINNGARRWVDLGEDKDIYLARGKWMPNSETFTYQWQTRDQQTLELRAYNVPTEKQDVLLSETSNTWVNLHNDLYFLSDSDQFIWASERDGFKHLYLYENSGKLVRQLTQGDWVVDNIEAVDAKSNRIYFAGRKDTPLESHAYSVSLDGGDISRITNEGAYHSVSFSKDASIFIDRFSTINSPAQVSLNDASGKRITWLEENKVEEGHPLHPYMDTWTKPEFGDITTKDGATLKYRIYKPENLEKKHPVIVYLYGGPHAQVVTNSWAGNRGLLMQHWVDKGYVVFTLDNRGSNYRGKAFEDPIYKKMGFIEVDDQVAGVEFLRTLPYVDAKRIGVHGHSYGGYMTLMTMFKAGDYFQAGVSGAPVTDWRLYDTHYTERYMGNPKTDDDAYTASSVFPYAKDLKGDLLIYHGMADDNVLFTHSTMLYKHLQDLAIPFETMDYPGKKHSIRGKQTGIHLYKTITNFFDRNLTPEQ
ncbi:S9 family peptidase [Alteromonas stellipolaris]|uniref:S9 family peptidase n=2 Tax=Alteromonas stellipolaris TaxID=233316 RepID=UPI0007B456A2|nr:S9 family peptidase [Alteromonas stellipolaris]ANB24959.1 peptidase S9 [Alteromonas stellipolaris]MBZ2161278.1 S9 family peptidase [Alteromonas stellipolaris]MDO6536339.1 S9 family peptidase [Alteromonas stellipolaris]MDO6627863.1 S9 family peptidase [Alteromonas stellipolaris]MDP2597752.1 S9 family peptidase [Alteromonas stellipolaris]